jgi:Sulfotransferase domain
LQVIGAGFGRTGTLSLKAALEMLGFAPCYHMMEVFAHPEHALFWDDATQGKPTDWKGFLAPYRAAADWPVCHFWRELHAAFPDAKMLLTERDPERWYESISQTIFMLMQNIPKISGDPKREAHGRMVRRIIDEQTFHGDYSKENAIAVYKAHNEAVKRALGSKLLVYDVTQGWEPLCRHLGVPVPQAEFPRINTTEDFLSRIAPMSSAGN